MGNRLSNLIFNDEILEIIFWEDEN